MARTMLLGSGRPSLGQRVEAYRVLSVVSPLAYLPKLAEALCSYGYAQEIRDVPDVGLARHAEAVEVARRVDDDDPKKTDLLIRTLDAYQHGLYSLGRRIEGLAICEEMAEAGRSGFARGQVRDPRYGQGPLAVVLAEEGRYAEVAELSGALFRSAEHGPGTEELSFWDWIEWVAALDASGRHEAALRAVAELAASTRDKWARDRSSSAILTWVLVHQAGMLDAAGHHAEAGTARKEVLGHLTELDLTGERRSWSNIHTWWSTLFALSGRTAEPAPSSRAPGPSFGSAFHQWSPDIKKAYFDGMAPLEEKVAELREAAATDPDGHLAELVAEHRRLVIRSAVFREHRSHRILQPLRTLFDEQVALARRLAERAEGADPAEGAAETDRAGKAELGRALTDRSMFLLAAHQYGEAHDDYVEVCALLN